jgi:hypothetical protein
MVVLDSISTVGLNNNDVLSLKEESFRKINSCLQEHISDFK